MPVEACSERARGDVGGAGRSEPAGRPGPAPGAAARGRRARGGAAVDPAGYLQAPAGAPGGRAGARRPRGAAADLRARSRPAGRARCLARSVPGVLERPPRRTRTAPRRDGGTVMTDLGTYVELDGRPAVRFDRTFPHPVDRVWRAVTEPAELVRWFPSAVRLEPRVGGTVTFSGDPYSEGSTGTVLAYEPPARPSFTWGPGRPHLTPGPA